MPRAVDDHAQSLDQACAELHRMVDQFKANWLRGRDAHPEQYPDVLPEGEWFEQFMSEATGGGLDAEAAR